MTFHRVNEDPWYDEDGVLVDEDADWEDDEDGCGGDLLYVVPELIPKEELSPFSTINS
jgi:hypothetical protein